MAERITPIDVTNMAQVRQLAEEVRRSGRRRMLRADSEDVAVIGPPPRSRGRAPSKAPPANRDEVLLELVGIGRSGKPSNASEHKHEALEEAHRTLHSS